MSPLWVCTTRRFARSSTPASGGDHVRVVLSNVFGTAPLEVGAAHIALRASEAGIVPTLGASLTFSGSRGIRIPAGAVAVTDPVALLVPPLVDLAIDVYLPEGSSTAPSRLTIHGGARQTSYVSRPGDHTGAANLPVLTTTESWLFLARVEVTPRQPTGAIVAIGDSITDGYSSTPNLNSRWPDYLARRLMARPDGSRMGVLNAGIDGNRILSGGMGVSALARFDRDVLAQTGATHVVVLLGINDLGLTRDDPRPSTADLITGHRQLIARARAQGLKVIGATLLPFEGRRSGSTGRRKVRPRGRRSTNGCEPAASTTASSISTRSCATRPTQRSSCLSTIPGTTCTQATSVTWQWQP